MEFCRCKDIKSIYTDIDDWGQWYVCNKCNKPIEGTYKYFNHYDGEDHVSE